MDFAFIYSVLCVVIKLPVTTPASYKDCSSVRGDVLLYHRRIKQDPTRHFSLQFVSFPESLIDLPDPRDIKVISCILCNDLHSNGTESECRLLGGGVGHTFAKFGISCGRGRGYDYDIKIYGKTTREIGRVKG